MSLKDRLIRQIRMDGPMPVSTFMQICLHDPKDGYYARGAGLGQDFITAPETSQMFGELLGAWAVNICKNMLSAKALITGQATQQLPVTLCEIGGGRGTLMADAMRMIKSAKMSDAFKLYLIEASPALQDMQMNRLANWSPSSVVRLDDLPIGNTVILANEFLDCLPARQFVQESETWRERIVGLSEAGTLAFGVDRSDITSQAASAMPPVSLRAEAELQPGLEGLVDTLRARQDQGDRFHALFIDYGPATKAPGDTLRAYKDGQQIDPLACPGEADLTVDVDFGRLVKLAKTAGLQVSGPITQSQFLARLGLQNRLNALIKANPEKSEALFEGAQKLVGPDQMGTRFKVICLSTPDLPAPIGFS